MNDDARNHEREDSHKRQFHALEGILTKNGTIFLEDIE
jgi:hypothetical protein